MALGSAPDSYPAFPAYHHGEPILCDCCGSQLDADPEPECPRGCNRWCLAHEVCQADEFHCACCGEHLDDEDADEVIPAYCPAGCSDRCGAAWDVYRVHDIEPPGSTGTVASGPHTSEAVAREAARALRIMPGYRVYVRPGWRCAGKGAA